MDEGEKDFEAGADAIVTYLLSQKHQDWLATEEGESASGTWVFIPDGDMKSELLTPE